MPNPENLIGKGFRENPQNINRKGRPKKLFAALNDEVIANGEEPVSRKDLKEFIMLCFNLNERELRKIATNKDAPFAARSIANELLSTKIFNVKFRELRDFVYGSGRQKTSTIRKQKESFNNPVRQASKVPEHPLLQQLKKAMQDHNILPKDN